MTKLSLEINGEKISWEVPEEDLSTFELANGFYQIMLGNSFNDKSILAGLAKLINQEGFSFEELLEQGRYYCNRWQL